MWERFITWFDKQSWGRLSLYASLFFLSLSLIGKVFFAEPAILYFLVMGIILCAPFLFSSRLIWKYTRGRERILSGILILSWLWWIPFFVLWFLGRIFPKYDWHCQLTAWGETSQTIGAYIPNFDIAQAFLVPVVLTLAVLLFSKFLFSDSRAREPLVIVLVFLVLAYIFLSGIRDVRSTGRDSRRIADLRNAQNALEVYYVRTGAYPNAGSYGEMESLIEDQLGTSPHHDPLCPRGDCVSERPQKPWVDYQFSIDPTLENYALGARLEQCDHYALESDIDGTVYGINCDDPVYCITF